MEMHGYSGNVIRINPTEKRLKTLGLDKVAEDLKRAGET
jgi:hypothetical protein